MVDLPPLPTGCPAGVRQALEASLRVKGARLFNILPKEIRDLDSCTVDTFKATLDEWLNKVPDQPTVPGRQRAALTNSLLHQLLLIDIN